MYVEEVHNRYGLNFKTMSDDFYETLRKTKCKSGVKIVGDVNYDMLSHSKYQNKYSYSEIDQRIDWYNSDFVSHVINYGE